MKDEDALAERRWHGRPVTARVRLRLRTSALDLAHALVRGTADLRPHQQSRLLAALCSHGTVRTDGAAYLAAMEWAEAVSSDRRPPSPIVFRSLGRDADWLAALEFLASALAACDQPSPHPANGAWTLTSQRC